MPTRIASTILNASTMDILNTIRSNASYEYQSLVPVVTTSNDIPKVGEVLLGYPSLANQFLNAVVNRIALVRVKAATFNNAYKELKKGYLEYGESVEEVFVNIAKAREFSAEKAKNREFARTLPDVRSAFHAMNWNVQYPTTIQNEDLRLAFLNIGGVEDLIAKIINSISIAQEYDEFLLFKYLIIKAVTHGKMKPIAFDSTDHKEAAEKFRGYSNEITFMSKEYNDAGVTTCTPKADQYIFMDAHFNAAYDVNVLASAFNMDKAEFMGKLMLVDSWTTFDNDRFSAIRSASDMIEEVTSSELALMADVKAVLVDKEWFQVYDNLAMFTEDYVASGMYWNYFYNVRKTVSSSPFSNALVFVDDGATTTLDDTYNFTIVSKSVSDEATVINGELEDTATLADKSIRFIQTSAATTDGIAVHRYGSFMFPEDEDSVQIECYIGDTLYKSATQSSTTPVVYTAAEMETDVEVGDEILLVKASLITA